jgi:His/Glu/Gln/Arg/opine family amino acid ABC transporter permease subunit
MSNVNFEFIKKAFPQILKYLPVTLWITVVTAVISLVLGLAFGLLKRKRIPVISQIFAVFLSYFRAVPTIVQLFVAYFAIQHLVPVIFPGADIYKIPPVLYAIIPLSLNNAAYASEIFKAALDSVDFGQGEAALSVGMTRWQALGRIILPQATVVALPPIGSLLLGLVQETSLVTYIGVVEITSIGIRLADSGLNFLESYLILTVIYEVISFTIGKTFRSTENRLGRFRPQNALKEKITPERKKTSF